MLYVLTRLLILVVLFAFIIMIRNTKFFEIKANRILTWLLIISTIVLLFAYPIENAFYSFETPESVFAYRYSGEIKHIENGDNSCMIVYNSAPSATHETWFTKDERGYKLPNPVVTTNISTYYGELGSCDICKVIDTNDYYFTGMIVVPQETLEISDNKGTNFTSICVSSPDQVSNIYVVYAYIENYSSNYVVSINGNEIKFS